MNEPITESDPGTLRPLPPLTDGVTVVGPGAYSFSGELTVAGTVTLRDLTLYLTGPAQVRAGAQFTLDRVHLVIADPPGSPNGTSRLTCDGPAHLIVSDSSLRPSGAAHPIWRWQGSVEMRRFQTHNAELRLSQTEAILEDTHYFELEISGGSNVRASRVSVVFLSTRNGPDEDLTFAQIPAARAFSSHLALGEGSSAAWDDSRLEILLVYLRGTARALFERVERTQIAFMLEGGSGTYRLPRGRLGTAAAPYRVPSPGDGVAGGPGVTLIDTGVDTWDAYISGGPGTRYRFVESVIDELIVRGSAEVQVERSLLYADWLKLQDDAVLEVNDSTVGALSLAPERPDLATSQVALDGRARGHFHRVRFDCGILAREDSVVTLEEAVAPPLGMTAVDRARIVG
jgi:hypothetical protein